MTFVNIWTNITRMVTFFVSVCDHTYHMIIDNTLLLCFILMCTLFVGLALLKRLIHIN